MNKRLTLTDVKKKYVKPEIKVVEVNIRYGPLQVSDIHDSEGNHRQLSGRRDLDDLEDDDDDGNF